MMFYILLQALFLAHQAIAFEVTTASEDATTHSWEGSTAPLFYSNATTLATTSMRFDFTQKNEKVTMVHKGTMLLQNGLEWTYEEEYAALYYCIQASQGTNKYFCSETMFTMKTDNSVTATLRIDQNPEETKTGTNLCTMQVILTDEGKQSQIITSGCESVTIADSDMKIDSTSASLSYTYEHSYDSEDDATESAQLMMNSMASVYMQDEYCTKDLSLCETNTNQVGLLSTTEP